MAFEGSGTGGSRPRVRGLVAFLVRVIVGVPPRLRVYVVTYSCKTHPVESPRPKQRKFGLVA